MPAAELTATTATIAASGTNVTADLAGRQLVGLFMPAAFTGTTVTITATSAGGGTYAAVKDSAGTTISALTFAASAYFALDPATFAGLRFLKLTSNGTEASARDIILMTRSW